MIKFHEKDGIKIAEETSTDLLITSVDDAIDLLGNLAFDNCSSVILYERNFHPGFFRLHTKLAGDVLQKFSNYNFRLAIIGDFSKYRSNSLQDFIRECNRGNRVFFLSDIDEAIVRLSGKQIRKT